MKIPYNISLFFKGVVCYKLLDRIKNCFPTLLAALKEGGKGGVCYINYGTRKILYPYFSGRVKGRGCLL
jgi:hypothetical protein